MKEIKKINQKEKGKIISILREVPVVAQELESLEKDGQETKGDWCSFDLLAPPMFIGKYFDF